MTMIKAQLWIFLIPVVLGLVQVGLFLEQTGFFLRNGNSSRRTSLLLWILGVYPVFSLTSLIGMFIPRASFVCQFVASITNLRCMTLAVYQLSLIRTILFFVTLILWTDEKYDYGDVSYTNPNSYINTIIGVSTFLSFYGYLLFYKATKPALSGYSLRSKFVCIILVLILCGLQSGILETMGALGAFPCRPPLPPEARSQIIYYYSLTFEMFFIGVFAHYSFRRVEPPPGTSPGTCQQASQTEEAPSGHCSFGDDTPMEGTNLGYVYDETLCTIEHSPLDQFDFTVREPLHRQQKGFGLGSLKRGVLRAEGTKSNLPCQTIGIEIPSTGVQIQAQVAKTDVDGATVV
ncbi:hypothetical protein lerEdw1_014728 [Lerista edwardsae]|nr:hypothetical protein lerEdw1_014728 [Lerista edwardsae]